MKLPGFTSNTTLIILLLFLTILFQNCSTNYENPDYLPSLKIQIPNDAKKDSALVSFIIYKERLINKLSNDYEDIASQISYYNGKDDDELSLFDKIRIVRLGINFYSLSNKFKDEIKSIEEHIEKKPLENINNVDISAYLSVREAIETRINKLNDKYNNTENIIYK
jgi:hypothetical protein